MKKNAEKKCKSILAALAYMERRGVTSVCNNLATHDEGAIETIRQAIRREQVSATAAQLLWLPSKKVLVRRDDDGRYAAYAQGDTLLYKETAQSCAERLRAEEERRNAEEYKWVARENPFVRAKLEELSCYQGVVSALSFGEKPQLYEGQFSNGFPIQVALLSPGGHQGGWVITPHSRVLTVDDWSMEMTKHQDLGVDALVSRVRMAREKAQEAAGEQTGAKKKVWFEKDVG